LKSFLIPASTGFYMMAYSLLFELTYLELDTFTSVLMYFGYMFIFSLTFFILCGTVGFLAANKFVRKIYSMIRLD